MTKEFEKMMADLRAVSDRLPDAYLVHPETLAEIKTAHGRPDLGLPVRMIETRYWPKGNLQGIKLDSITLSPSGDGVKETE